MDLKSLLSHWRSDPQIGQNIVSWQVIPRRNADLWDMPDGMNPALSSVLLKQGINQLYSHQAAAFQQVNEGRNIAIVTGTASGKTLCYNLPVLNRILEDPHSHALFIFPTKALAQDQLTHLAQFSGLPGKPIIANIYDGDTAQQSRQMIRKTSQIILTNPDMLHNGILPHHTIWKEFFSTLKYVVIDEMHIYRGVFGSHVANVLRRLKRIAAFYGAYPQFILTSATIANAQQLAEKLVEELVALIDQDGSPSGQRNFLLYNPPLVDEALGLRKSSLQEATMLGSQLIRSGCQTILFGRSRRAIELLLTNLRNQNPDLPDSALRGYRSGYLRQERREIEQGLRNNTVQAVAATSALELGIDIGNLDAALIVGYPGSIAAARQQAGRAGRRNNTSLAVMITAANPMDQYLALHPEYFYERNPEQALIEPNNLLILLQHIRSAAFELPFSSGDTFGKIDPYTLAAYLELLSASGELHAQNNRFYWVSDQYPAAGISLRNASPDVISIVLDAGDQAIPQTIGHVDRSSAFWMVHPEAVYIHEAQPYYVQSLDLETGVAHLKQQTLDYFTEPKRKTTIEDHQAIKIASTSGAEKFFGNLTIVDQVVGYRKIRWFTQEHLGGGEVDLPPTRLETVGYWLGISENVVEKLRSQMQWNADPNDYGHSWEKTRLQVLDRDGRRCRVCGISESLQPLHVHHIQPFRTFTTLEAANALSNLVTLCPTCHKLAEQSIRIRSGLAGVTYLLGNLAPLILMCDNEDIGILSEPQSALAGGQPAIVFYDNVPGGIGLSEHLFERHHDLVSQGFETILACPCSDGCPTCVGPIGAEGFGGKSEALALLKEMV